MKANYTKEQIIEIVNNALSIAECLRLLNLRPAGGNYKMFNRLIKLYNISIDHFTGQAWNRGKKIRSNRKIPLNKILIEESTYISTNSLRKRLLNEGIKKYQCEKCLNETWNDSLIPLELDHINGINTDNRIENLRLLCPNCHAQTNNYKGKNKTNHRAELSLSKYKNKDNLENITPKLKTSNKIERYDACECGNTKHYRSTKCPDCYLIQKSEMSKRPCYDDLLEDFKLLKSFVQVGKKYGVSDNAVRKWIKLYKIDIQNFKYNKRS